MDVDTFPDLTYQEGSLRYEEGSSTAMKLGADPVSQHAGGEECVDCLRKQEKVERLQKTNSKQKQRLFQKTATIKALQKENTELRTVKFQFVLR